MVHATRRESVGRRRAVGPLRVAAGPPPSLLRWTVLCAAAEAVGMTAAAASARTAQAAVGEPAGGAQVALVLSLVVAGGLVEGVALGVAQSTGLARWLPGSRRTRWVVVTLVVAGLGWAAASAPAVLAGGAGEADGGDGPPLALVLAGAVGLGAVMGAVLGWAQSTVLRGQVRNAGRWVGANVLAWGAAMPVIFLGATTPSASWSAAAVVVLGTVTGLAAGTVLGIVTGLFLSSMTPTGDRRDDG